MVGAEELGRKCLAGEGLWGVARCGFFWRGGCRLRPRRALLLTAVSLVALEHCLGANLVMSQEQNASPSCDDDPEQAKCCDLTEQTPCLIKEIIKPADGCSLACQKRFESLGYECFTTYGNHWQWKQMQDNCDPQGRIKFEPTPAPRQKQQKSPEEAQVDAGLRRSTEFPSAQGLMAVILFFLIVVARF